MAAIVEIKAIVDGREKTFVGRFAWALHELIVAGDSGITSLQNPAPRLSHYIFRLRRDGVGIASDREDHTGPYSGSHVRYRLTSSVNLLEAKEAA